MYKSMAFFLVLLAARFTQLVQLYFTSIPSGGLLTEQPIKYFVCASIVEISVFTALFFSFSHSFFA